MLWSLSLMMMIFWFGPAAALLIVSLVMEQRRHAPNGTDPRGNLVLRSLIGGIVAAVAWVILIMTLVLITQAGNAGLWIVFAPWAFAIGQGTGLFWRSANIAPRR